MSAKKPLFFATFFYGSKRKLIKSRKRKRYKKICGSRENQQE
jgi:hypothetical protein